MYFFYTVACMKNVMTMVEIKRKDGKTGFFCFFSMIKKNAPSNLSINEVDPNQSKPLLKS